MIIFLYGPDSYRSKQKLDEIVSHYKSAGKSGLNLVHVNCTETDMEDFQNHFKISSMFAEKKLIILHNIFSAKKFQEDFADQAKHIEAMSDVVVIYQADEPDKRLKLFKLLTKECKSQEFAPLDGRGLKAWIQSECQKLGAKMNADAMDLLAIYVGNDLWRASSELKKLATFKNGTTIKKDDVEQMVRPRIELDIFKTIDALAAKNKKQAMALVQKHLDGGDNVLYLLSMIAYQFRNLLVVKELAQQGLMYASIIKKSALHPFVVKKTYFQCHQFSFEELTSIYQKIFQIDSDIKTGNIEPEVALDLLISQI